jgi:hypothetical protein
MKYLSSISGAIILTLSIFLWGVATAAFEYWPWQHIKGLIEFGEFVAGHPDEPGSSIFEKIESDSGGIPYRYLGSDKTSFEVEGGEAFSVDEKGFLFEGFQNGEIDEGYFLIAGAFNLGQGYNLASVLLNYKGEYIRHWRISKPGQSVTIDEERNTILYPGNIQKVDWCSEEGVVPEHLYKGAHHSVEMAPDGTYWTLYKDRLVQLDPNIKEGKKLKVLKDVDLVKDVVPANAYISPLTTRFYMKWNISADPGRNHPVIGFLEDPFHNNDLQPFVDDRFQTSSGYALAASVRQQNLVLILDPETMEILWYAQGLTERQHDIDYYNGDFYIYDNGSFRGYSRIAKISIDSKFGPDAPAETVIDGSKFSWLDPSRGQHEVLSFKEKTYHLLINDRRGRFYVFDENQNPVFALRNLFKVEGSKSSDSKDVAEVIQLRNAMYVSEAQYQRLESNCIP